MEVAPATAPPAQALVTAVLIQPAMAVLSIVVQEHVVLAIVIVVKAQMVFVNQLEISFAVLLILLLLLNQPQQKVAAPYPRRRHNQLPAGCYVLPALNATMPTAPPA